MKIKIATEARVSADGKRCLESCQWFRASPQGVWCEMHGCDLKLDFDGPIRCRACLRAEVPPCSR